jgi:flagellar protein FlaG
MVSAPITEGILLIGAVIMAAGISAAVMGHAGVFQSAFSTATSAEKDIILTKIKILYATNSSSTTATVWVKNIGSNPITGVENVDVYFGKIGSITRIPYNTGSAPQWTFAAPVNVWQTKDTVQLNISLDQPLAQNTTYSIRVSAPNGVSDDYVFSTS